MDDSSYEQLPLKLGMAWNGVSPRYLTGAYARFSLDRERTTWPVLELPQTLHAAQFELFPEGTSYGP